MALPTQARLASLNDGQTIPWVTPADATPNTAGIVNLEAALSYCDPSTVIRKWRKRWTVVAQSYATVKGITLSFTYGKGQSYSLAVGISPTGKKGSFTVSRTISVSTDATETFPNTRGRRLNYWQTLFGYHEYKQHCEGSNTYWIQAYQCDTGSRIKHPKGAAAAVHCAPRPRTLESPRARLPHRRSRSASASRRRSASTARLRLATPPPRRSVSGGHTGACCAVHVPFLVDQGREFLWRPDRGSS